MTDEGNKKEPAVKLTRKERRQRWKQKKQERRQTLKEYYRDAPWIVRVPRLYLLNPIPKILLSTSSDSMHV